MEITEDLKAVNVPVEEHYAGKSVLITGATGFLGKVFVEKLLYSCPKIDKIYLLIRKKGGSDTTTTRIKKLLDLPIFQRVKNERPDDFKKIVPVDGDIVLPNLGICEEDMESLINEVSYVFHFAANVKFNMPLKVAMEVIVEGTRRVLGLCQHIKNIKAFVYISTTYSNTDQTVLEEIVYPPPATLDEIYSILANEENNEAQIKNLLYGRPNTYSLAKALAESVVNEESRNVPTVIIRPSIVSASYNEPLLGWIDNWYGATALVGTIAKGHTRILISKKSNTIDLIPVDYVCNLTIAAAAKYIRSKQVTVYNSCTSATNPLTMGHLFQLIAEDCNENQPIYRKFLLLNHNEPKEIKNSLTSIHYLQSNPGNAVVMIVSQEERIKNPITVQNPPHIILERNYDQILKPSLICTKYEWLLIMITVMMQIVPAFLADCWLRLMRKPPRFMRAQRRIALVRNSLKYFTSRTWMMKCDRTRELFASLSVSERIQFPFDPAHIVWSKYIPIYLRGIREFLYK